MAQYISTIGGYKMFLDSCKYMHCLPNIYCLNSSDKQFGVLCKQFQNNSVLNAFCLLFYCTPLSQKKNNRYSCVRIYKYLIFRSMLKEEISN